MNESKKISALIYLEHYARVTSPLRRYPDFITHYQIKAMIRGGKRMLPFSHEDLTRIMPEIHYTTKKIHSLQMHALVYWKTRYLIQEKKKKNTYSSYLALVVFIGDKFGKNESLYRMVQVHIPALQMNTTIRLLSSLFPELKEGDLIQLVVDHNDGSPNVSFTPFSAFPMGLQESVEPPEPIERYIPLLRMSSILQFLRF